MELCIMFVLTKGGWNAYTAKAVCAFDAAEFSIGSLGFGSTVKISATSWLSVSINLTARTKTQNRKRTCPSWWPHPFPNGEWLSMDLLPGSRDRGKSSTRCWWRHRNPFPTTKADKMWGSLLPQHVSNLCIYANTDLKGDGVLSLGHDDIVGVCCCCFCCLLLLLLVVGGCCCCMVCNTCSLVALSSLPSNKKWGSMRSTKAEHLMMT